ncbi:MAG: hypothetical protein KME11_04915 [Timaviella obliquedivisa GSE-PSE-MK23-08B]|jgi:6-pyruvoyl-tetrahydropterin synthase|nr:hypothetical protein [Timaviella obliquedivisa GSE-PSE-MK23-08B]
MENFKPSFKARSHYPEALRGLSVPYSQGCAHECPVIFHYQISHSFRRRHFNPPIWQDDHWHDFRVTLHLQAERSISGMYGLDMIEQENLLKYSCSELPELINDHQDLAGGTTEDLCLYFAKIQLDPHIKLLRVDVFESPERVTSLVR